MEKIININFQGRVIPIEESAYETLKQYTDGLRRHFAAEESSDEIIQDIENRIAELLTVRLKQGAPCINNIDINAVIDSIGRLEDIKAAEGEEQVPPHSGSGDPVGAAPINGRFFRNTDDKVIAGVCSGIGIRMNIDPIVVRVIFVLLFGALFWIYILLWLIVPSQSIRTNTTRRLFRNAEDKVLAGVCSGLAVYFRMDSWKVRLIFLLPLIVSVLFKSMHVFTWHMGIAPGFFIGSFGSTFFILYVILWIALPYATTATDKMEMRGEKIDINSIKAASMARAGAPASRPMGSGLGRVIGILFKAFFLLIAGSIALGLFAALIGLVFAGTATMPFADFMLDNWNQYAIAWTGVALTLGIPMLALIVWMIRRLMGVRSNRHYLGYVFSGLWIIGVVCALYMTGTIMRNFTTRAAVDDQLQVDQPSTGRLYVNVATSHGPWHASRHNRWFGDWEENDDFHIINNDSLWLNTVKVNIEQSPDSLFHVYQSRASRGVNQQQAQAHASNISFSIQQTDSILTLPRGFTVSKKDKFRNQQVLLTIEVPMGKAVQVSKDINDYSWFTINTRGHGVYHSRHHDNGYYGDDREYMMTANGLKMVQDSGASKREDWHYED
ncbi:MAG: PspC domain-containing protein [Bacteroidota bacterium]